MKSFLLSLLLLFTWPPAQKAAGSQDTAATPRLPTTDVFDRLIAQLAAIPARWESLPAPVVPVSGRSVDEVLGSASDGQKQKASRWIARLRSTPPSEQPALIHEELRSYLLTEVDVWFPGQLVQSQAAESLSEAAATLEAWLYWTEALGRKDALLFAASFAIDILRIGQGASTVLPIIQAWATLPPAPGTERSQAVLQTSWADILLRLREKQKALDAYRKARQLYRDVGFKLGEGNAWRGEAEVLHHLGGKQEKQKTLDAYRNARRLFQTIGNQLSQGNTWLGEAEILSLLGQNQTALKAYQNARQLFQDAEDPLQPKAVPGTQGATGLAWRDAQTLLVTVHRPACAQLLRVPVSGKEPAVLWAASGGDAGLAFAPLALPDGRIAFVRQGAASTLLSVWENGTVIPERDLALPFGIHQLVASDSQSGEILALTLGAEDNRPAFLRIDLTARSVENLGFHPALYQAFFKAPQENRALIAFEDNAGQTGWDLALVDASGKLVKNVQARPVNDLLPVWQPGGREAAFLAEVEGGEVQP